MSDPFAKIYYKFIRNEKHKWRSSIVQKNYNPVWKNRISFKNISKKVLLKFIWRCLIEARFFQTVAISQISFFASETWGKDFIGVPGQYPPITARTHV